MFFDPPSFFLLKFIDKNYSLPLTDAPKNNFPKACQEDAIPVFIPAAFLALWLFFFASFIDLISTFRCFACIDSTTSRLLENEPECRGFSPGNLS